MDSLCEELPGANTQGRTLEEARENLKETVQLIIEANRELSRRESENKDIIRAQTPRERRRTCPQDLS
ncbi:MAG: type II toxin-antitoxin system HicB family antitoxin [Anaerolineae bacterium]